MIEYFSENDFELNHPKALEKWLEDMMLQEGYVPGEISYVFCTDEYLHQINLDFLEHDTFTDIISFDYSLGKEIHGEIYISTERVAENAKTFGVSFEDELHRVMAHGILHYCGYKDKNPDEVQLMREKEEKALNSRTFV